MGRAVLLLLVAVVLGIFLLNGIDDEGDPTVVQTAETDDTEPEKKSTISTLSPATTTTMVRAAKEPSSVKVLAVNGTTTSGVGNRAKEVMLASKYNTLAPTDASQKLKPVKTTTVYYQPGFDVDAIAVASLFQLPATVAKPLPADVATMLRETRNLANANIVLIAGEDIIPKLPATTTTTTAKRATTTTARPAGSSTTTSSSTTSTTAKP